MTNVDIIKNFYASDNFRDLDLVNKIVDDAIILEWNSSVGNFKYNKDDILKLSNEMFLNYLSTKIEIETIFGESDKVAVKYKFFVTTIENPNELVLIANMMVIWKFKNGKLIHGYQTSVLA